MSCRLSHSGPRGSVWKENVNVSRINLQLDLISHKQKKLVKDKRIWQNALVVDNCLRKKQIFKRNKRRNFTPNFLNFLFIHVYAEFKDNNIFLRKLIAMFRFHNNIFCFWIMIFRKSIMRTLFESSIEYLRISDFRKKYKFFVWNSQENNQINVSSDNENCMWANPTLQSCVYSYSLLRERDSRKKNFSSNIRVTSFQIYIKLIHEYWNSNCWNEMWT